MDKSIESVYLNQNYLFLAECGSSVHFLAVLKNLVCHTSKDYSFFTYIYFNYLYVTQKQETDRRLKSFHVYKNATPDFGSSFDFVHSLNTRTTDFAPRFKVRNPTHLVQYNYFYNGWLNTSVNNDNDTLSLKYPKRLFFQPFFAILRLLEIYVNHYWFSACTQCFHSQKKTHLYEIHLDMKSIMVPLHLILC